MSLWGDLNILVHLTLGKDTCQKITQIMNELTLECNSYQQKNVAKLLLLDFVTSIIISSFYNRGNS